MRTHRFVPLLVLLAAGCAHVPAPAPTQPVFTFQSNVWVNLHHFLRAVARGEPVVAKLTAEERAVWDRAVATYAAKYMNRNVVHEEGMVAIKDALRRVRDDERLPEIPGEPELDGLLEEVAPIYRKYWWAAHDTMHRSWMAALHPLLERYGERLSRDVPAAYGARWPSDPLPIDLSVNAGPVGAYTTTPPHTTLTSADRSYHGLAALEMVFHEASHQWGRGVSIAIREAAEARHKDVPPQLWHAVLFYNAGELTRRALRDDGIAGYTEYGVQEDLYKDLCGAGCRERVVKHWTPHLDGTISMEAALQNLVADWPG